jgi:hypothetical protein
VANYDTETALTIERLGGPTDTILGTTIPLLPLLLPLLVIILLVVRQWWIAAVAAVSCLLVAQAAHTDLSWLQVARLAWGGLVSYAYGMFGGEKLRELCVAADPVCRSYPSPFRWAWPPIRLSGTIVAERPLLSLLILGAMLAAILGIGVDLTEGTAAAWGYTLAARFFLAIFVPIVVALGFSAFSAIYPIPPRDNGIWMASLHRPWLPPEIITLTDGTSTVAYLLGEKDGWKALMIDRGREIRYVTPLAIRTRQVCSLTTPVRKTPFWGSTDMVQANYRLCYPPGTRL